jgi:hypothetical protein
MFVKKEKKKKKFLSFSQGKNINRQPKYSQKHKLFLLLCHIKTLFRNQKNKKTPSKCMTKVLTLFKI